MYSEGFGAITIKQQKEYLERKKRLEYYHANLKHREGFSIQ